MNLLLISRDRKFIARMKKLFVVGFNTVMVIPTVGWVSSVRHVPTEPDVVLFDIAGLKPKVWPKKVADLRKILDWKVIVVDRRGNARRAATAFENYAVSYLSKAKRTTDMAIRETVTYAFRSGLPLLPSEY